MFYDMLQLEKVICTILELVALHNLKKYFIVNFLDLWEQYEIFDLNHLSDSYSYLKLFLGCQCNGGHNAIFFLATNDEGKYA